MTERLRIVAIDGPAGAGKSTIAKALAKSLNIPYLDTGAMYRMVTYAALRDGVDPQNEIAVADVAKRMNVVMASDRFFVDEVDVTDVIRGPQVTEAVSIVAALSAVRNELRTAQRVWVSQSGGGVVEGRDIGTVVFPDATVKVFLTASPAVRAQRRVSQSGGDVLEIEEQIRKRDHLDSTRADSPLRESNDSLFIDTTDLSIESVVQKISSLVATIESKTDE
ncbi:MAG: (d)CMP kinase [Actinobacteria bacterium]|nr:(d)CMP kinase [Actinomycetota bacterium]